MMLNEEATGDCFVVAGRGVAFFDLGRDPVALKLKADGAKAHQLKCVHAMVTGQGKLEGIRYEHAWIEYNNKVYDFSNGGSYVLNPEVYYKVGNIDPKNRAEYRAYSADEIMKKILATSHWGPWA